MRIRPLGYAPMVSFDFAIVLESMTFLRTVQNQVLKMTEAVYIRVSSI